MNSMSVRVFALYTIFYAQYQTLRPVTCLSSVDYLTMVRAISTGSLSLMQHFT